MIINFNKIFPIYLILILFSCSKSELSDNSTKDVHDQLSSNVEITLTKKGNITAKIKSELCNIPILTALALMSDRQQLICFTTKSIGISNISKLSLIHISEPTRPY